MKIRSIYIQIILYVLIVLSSFNSISYADDQNHLKDKFKIGTYYHVQFTEPLDEVIQWDKLDYTAYAFVIPNPDGTLKKLEDPDKLMEMSEKAHENNVKLILSVGGWSWEDVPLLLLNSLHLQKKLEKYL